MLFSFFTPVFLKNCSTNLFSENNLIISAIVHGLINIASISYVQSAVPSKVELYVLPSNKFAIE